MLILICVSGIMLILVGIFISGDEDVYVKINGTSEHMELVEHHFRDWLDKNGKWYGKVYVIDGMYFDKVPFSRSVGMCEWWSKETFWSAKVYGYTNVNCTRVLTEITVDRHLYKIYECDVEPGVREFDLLILELKNKAKRENWSHDELFFINMYDKDILLCKGEYTGDWMHLDDYNIKEDVLNSGSMVYKSDRGAEYRIYNKSISR